MPNDSVCNLFKRHQALRLIQTMEVQDLIDPKNEQLYASIKEFFKINLIENPDWRASAWSSSIEKETVIIKFGATSFPQACFAHELRRIEMIINGFKPVFSGISLHKTTQQFLPTIIKYLNRTFQDHKTAVPFVAMGYSPEHFYEQEEYPMADFLLEELEKEGHSSLYIALLYLDFTAPLTNIDKEQKLALQIAFDHYQGGEFRPTFLRIDEIIHDWVHDAAYNAEAYFIDFLSTIGIKDTWFSYEKNASDHIELHFPDSGFFIGNSFTAFEIENRENE